MSEAALLALGSNLFVIAMIWLTINLVARIVRRATVKSTKHALGDEHKERQEQIKDVSGKVVRIITTVSTAITLIVMVVFVLFQWPKASDNNAGDINPIPVSASHETLTKEEVDSKNIQSTDVVKSVEAENKATVKNTDAMKDAMNTFREIGDAADKKTQD